MKEVRFAQYRAYSEGRVTANNSMIALLAGSRLAAHTLQLHAGSPHQLPGLYPGVLDIDRFNLLPDAARELLEKADAELAAVAIPYALAVYEAFVKDAIEMVRDSGFPVPSGWRPLQAGAMHDTFFTAVGVAPPTDEIQLFHLLRTMRNSQIHHAGQANNELIKVLIELSFDQQALWEELAMDKVESLVIDGRVAFTIGHLVASFAVTKTLARKINATLAAVLTRDAWADVATADYASGSNEPRNSIRWRRKLEGFARFHYQPLALQPQELEAAARRAGVWTGAPWEEHGGSSC